MALLRHGDVLLETPDNWRDLSQVVLVGPFSNSARAEPRVVVSRHELIEPQSAPDFGRTFAANLPEAMQNCRVTEEGSLSLEGIEAYRLVAEFQPGEAPPVTRLQLFATRGLDLFILTADTPTEVFTQFRPTLERIMQSFRLVNSP